MHDWWPCPQGWVRVEGFSKASWWSRLDAAGSRRFLSPQMEVLLGLQEVEVAMGIEGYSEEQVSQFKGLFENQGGDAALGKHAQKLDDPLSSVSVKKEKALENVNKREKKSEDSKKTRKSPQTKRPANVAYEEAKSKEARIEVKKEQMDEVITVKRRRGWRR